MRFLSLSGVAFAGAATCLYLCALVICLTAPLLISSLTLRPRTDLNPFPHYSKSVAALGKFFVKMPKDSLRRTSLRGTSLGSEIPANGLTLPC